MKSGIFSDKYMIILIFREAVRKGRPVDKAARFPDVGAGDPAFLLQPFRNGRRKRLSRAAGNRAGSFFFSGDMV